MLHAASAMVVAIRIVLMAVVSLSINRCPVYLNGDCCVGFRCLCWFVIGLWSRSFAYHLVLLCVPGIYAVRCFRARFGTDRFVFSGLESPRRSAAGE